MEIIMEWKKEEERRNRHVLSDSQWVNVILCLGSEGYSVKQIQEILTLGRESDQGIRDLWMLGLGKAPKWTTDQEKQAYDIIWSFFKQDIDDLYHGKTDSDGKIVEKGLSTINIQRIIHETTGFKLPSQSMQNQMEKVWRFSMRKRPDRPKSKAPSTSSISFEDLATVLSEGQDYQDLQDHKVKRDIRAESSKPSPLQEKLSQFCSTPDDSRFRHLEKQIMILTEDFQTALAIGHSQDVTLKSVTEQLQQLNNEVALLRSENSSLGIQNDDLRKKNCFLEARVDELLGFKLKLEAGIDDLRSKTLELQEEVNNLDALKLENQSLRTQKAILLKEHERLKHTLVRLVTKIQQLPNTPEHTLRNEVENLGKMYSCNKFKDDSPRDSVDSAYYSNNLEFESRQSLNMAPIRFQTVTNNQVREMGGYLDSNPKQRHHCGILQVDMPMSISDTECLHEPGTTPAKPPLTKSEFGDQNSLRGRRNDSVVEIQMIEAEDIPMQDCVLPAGPVFTAIDGGFGEHWDDPIMLNPPQQIPNFNRYNQANEGLECCN